MIEIVLQIFEMSTLFCLIVGGSQIANFVKKNPQVHLIIIREWPKNDRPILRNLDNVLPGAFYWTSLL